MNVAVFSSNWYTCAQTQPCGVFSKMKVNASSNLACVPSQTNLHRRVSMSGWNTPSYSRRTVEFSPSVATTRSYSLRYSSAVLNSVSNRRSTPNSRARACRITSIVLRPIPANPCPPDTVRTPSCTTAMSSQYENFSRMACVDTGSFPCIRPSASSDNTTPQPNVSLARLRSSTVTSCEGSRSFIEIAK